jgi:GT2 family glycosyltransferase
VISTVAFARTLSSVDAQSKCITLLNFFCYLFFENRGTADGVAEAPLQGCSRQKPWKASEVAAASCNTRRGPEGLAFCDRFLCALLGDMRCCWQRSRLLQAGLLFYLLVCVLLVVRSTVGRATRHEESTVPVRSRRVAVNDVTVIVKSMDRSVCLLDMIRTLRAKHPELTVVVADDGEEDMESALLSGGVVNVSFYKMPKDSGLSRGRNLMISQVTTRYVLLLDDDFKLSNSTLEAFLDAVGVYPDADIIGGRAGLDFSGEFEINLDQEILFLKHGSKSGDLCPVVHFVPNFFLARTEVLRQVQWDNDLKVGEHEDFFIRAQRAGVIVRYCRHIHVTNLQIQCAARNIVRHSEGRARAFSFMAKGLRKHGLSRIVYCLGSEFVGRGWRKVSDKCWEVPLPELCPIGWTGIRCARCADGWEGDQCDRCSEGYFGKKCFRCSCFYPGQCMERYEKDQPTVYCSCPAFLFGNRCHMLSQGHNLLGTLSSNKLRLWQEGCLVQRKASSLIFSGEMSRKCGIGSMVKVSPPATKLAVSVSVRLLSLPKFASTSALALYVDVTFVDGQNEWGIQQDFSYFDEGPQTRSLLIERPKAISQVSVYVLSYGITVQYELLELEGFRVEDVSARIRKTHLLQGGNGDATGMSSRESGKQG